MRHIVWLSLIALTTSSAHAGGIFVPGTGPSAQARAGAFVAKSDDPTALAHNPAGFAKTTGTVVYVGFNLIDFNLDYTRAGQYEDPHTVEDFPTVSDDTSPSLGIAGFQAVPLIAVATDLGMPELPVRFAAGIYAPQGFPGRDFDDSVGGDHAPQRYDVMNQEAVTALPSLAVAYRPIPQLDIGVRASWGIAELKAKTSVWGIRNYEENKEKDGVFTVDVSDGFVPAWGAGVLYRPTEFLEVGAAYSSALHVRARGTGTAALGSELGVGDTPERILPQNDPQYALCDPNGTMLALAACVDIDLPQTATVGVRYVMRDAAGNEKADVELDVRWEDWDSKCDLPEDQMILGETTRNCSDHYVIVDAVSELTGFVLQPSLIKHGMKDVYSIRLGGSYQVVEDVKVSGGLAHDTESAKLEVNRVDMDGAPRTTIAVGVAYTFGNYRIDFGGGYVYEPERVVEQCKPPTGPTVADPGCASGGGETPIKEREAPDPIQPLTDISLQFESPFNAGTYNSSYLLLNLGFTARF